MNIYKEIYGETQEGKRVFQYTMTNSKGMKVSVLNLGGIITRVLVPDRSGSFENVVLTLNSLGDYEDNTAYIGCVVGRYAGRIKDGAITIDGKEYYRLDKNDGENSLHGGFKGLNKVIWDVEERVEDSFCELKLSYLSRDGEGGFPGNVKIDLLYKVYEDNSLEISYEAISDKQTAISLTNHSYFNLSGDIEAVMEHNLWINNPFLLEVGEDMIVGDRIIDLRHYGLRDEKNKRVRDYIEVLEKVSRFRGIDHPFIVGRTDSCDLALAVEYKHRDSGRSLLVYTDMPYINIYSGNFLDKNILLKGGREAIQYGGICFETQEQPNGPHNQDLGYKFLEANELYKGTTVFKFITK